MHAAATQPAQSLASRLTAAERALFERWAAEGWLNFYVPQHRKWFRPDEVAKIIGRVNYDPKPGSEKKGINTTFVLGLIDSGKLTALSDSAAGEGGKLSHRITRESLVLYLCKHLSPPPDDAPRMALDAVAGWPLAALRQFHGALAALIARREKQ